MESRTINVTLEQAREWYNVGGLMKDLALQAYSEKEIVGGVRPKSWKEFCKMKPDVFGEYFINNVSSICEITVDVFPIEGGESIEHKRNPHSDLNILPTEEAAYNHLALMQLHQLRDCYRDGWEPNWASGEIKYNICKYNGTLTVVAGSFRGFFLSFQDLDRAEEFLANFKELIEQAGDLI